MLRFTCFHISNLILIYPCQLDAPANWIHSPRTDSFWYFRNAEVFSSSKTLHTSTIIPSHIADSILENIRYSKPDATLEEVRTAARLANAADFIESFPQQYDTVVGERGVTLSGGTYESV